MRTSEWSRASWPLGAILDGFEPFKRGFVRQHEWVAECIYADSSNHNRTAFYVEAFALPLFIPADNLYFDYGGRVGAQWHEVSTELVRAVEVELPSLRERATLDGLVRSAQRPQVNVHHAELHLCIALIRGDEEQFESWADNIGAWKQQIDWEGPIVKRCIELVEVARVNGAEAGVRLLSDRRPGVLGLLT